MERLSASKAARLIACSASGNLEVAIPHWNPPIEDRDANTAANRGTRMHEILAELNTLSARELTAFGAALSYIGEVRSRRRFTMLVEQTEMADWLMSPVPTTADIVLFTQDELHIIDFKWGKIPVEVVDNKQLLHYAVTYGKYAPKAQEVTVHIVQPNAGLFTSWVADLAALSAFMDEAMKAEGELLTGNLTFMPGDHCQFCPANPHSRGAKGSPLCPAMMQVLYPAPFDEAALLAEES